MVTRVFLGPTLSAAEARGILPADIHPPVSMGDVFRSVEEGFTTLVLVDGFFHGQPAVWHKEILYGLSKSCIVVGCSSMGALRAAELAAYGMQGHGRIFAQYRSGQLEADDEVAVAHSDGASGYRRMSEAMVNIRYGMSLAVRAGAIRPDAAAVLVAEMKSVFYAERHWERVIQAAVKLGLTTREIDTLRHFLTANNTDLKRQDAVQTLRWVAEGGHRRHQQRLRPAAFEATYSWQTLEMTEAASNAGH